MPNTVRRTQRTRKPTLRDLMEARDLTPTDLASRSGLGLTTVLRLLGGHGTKRRSTVRLLAGALRVGMPECAAAIARRA
jgi:hypothetical protein